MREESELRVSAPGRIVLFGEHQDYLGLPIIAAAINLRITISGRRRKDRILSLNLPDTDEHLEFPIDKEAHYEKDRDYLRSGFNILQRKGVFLRSGWECTLRGNIPINSGTASSSALVVAWIKFLLEASGSLKYRTPEEIAELGFEAEVAEFNEPGGKMDHYTSALGGVISIHFDEKLRIRRFKNQLGQFVLADSMEKKDTTGMLGFIKGNVLRGVEKVKKSIEDFSLQSSLNQDAKREIKTLPADEKRLLLGTLLTRDLTVEGEKLFSSIEFNHARFGQLLTEQYRVLKEYLHLSTPKLEKLIETSLRAGALGAKINGSGGGGCIFAYAPGKAEKVAHALQSQGAKADIISIDRGAKAEKREKHLPQEEE